MKFIHLTTIAALSTSIFSGASVTAFAEEETIDPKTPSTETRRVTTDGQIIFTPNTDEELIVIPPETGPERPDIEIDPEVPGTTGPLSIMKAATMNFGSQVISNQDQSYNMVAEMAKLTNPEEDGPKEVPYVSFAQVQDIRGTNSGWNLQVSLSNFTSNTQNNILTGAQIELNNPRLEYIGTAKNAPSVHPTSLVLRPNNAAVPVMTAAKGKGAGASSVVWGNQASLNRQFNNDNFDSKIDVVENEAIKLSVPGSTAKDATTYTSTLTWELTTIPGEEGPGEPDPEIEA